MYVAGLLDRVDVRWIMSAGAVFGGLALLGVGQVEVWWQLYLLFALFGMANSGVSLVVATTVITRWFPGPNRSVALSIASTGLSLGGVLITPLTARLFNTWGMAETMPTLGVAFAVLILPLAIWVVRMPPATGSEPSHAGASVMHYRQAVRSRFFVLLALGYVFCMGAQVGGIAHVYSRLELLGDFTTGASAVQALTISSILGRFVGGFVVMWLPMRWLTLGMLLVQMVGLGLIGSAASPAVGVVGAALFGASVGNLLMLQPLWLAETFPGNIYPRVFALANALSVIGVAVGPYLMGLTYDTWDYGAAYMVAVGVSGLAWVLVFCAGARPVLAAGR
jgi:predicted MFS family arabinose efflux permease